MAGMERISIAYLPTRFNVSCSSQNLKALVLRFPIPITSATSSAALGFCLLLKLDPDRLAELKNSENIELHVVAATTCVAEESRSSSSSSSPVLISPSSSSRNYNSNTFTERSYKQETSCITKLTNVGLRSSRLAKVRIYNGL